MTTERRKHSPEIEQANQDRLTIRWIVGTVCVIAIALTATYCYCTLASIKPPESFNGILNIVIGALIGWIGKTAVTAVAKTNESLPADIGQAVVAASEKAPIQTQDAGETTNDNAN